MGPAEPEHPSALAPPGYAEVDAGMPEVFRCTWSRSGSVRDGAAATVLPDACADVVVDQNGAAVLVGPTMIPHRMELEPSMTLWGLRLQPWAIALIFRTTATDFRDRVMSLDDVLGTREAREVAEAVREGHVPARWRGVDTTPWQMALVKRLLNAPGSLVEETGRGGGVSERQARRTTRQLTGLSPRELAQVGRLSRVLPLMDQVDLSLVEMAAQVGYTDQAHMTHTLKRLAGVTPRRLREERSDLERWSADRALRTVSDLLT